MWHYSCHQNFEKQVSERASEREIVDFDHYRETCVMYRSTMQFQI